MTDQELIARAEDLIAAWNRHDVDRIVAAFSPDVRFRDPIGGSALAGREVVRADAEALLEAVPDLQLEPRRAVAIGQVVTHEWTARGALATGLRHGVSIADYDTTGRITCFARYWSVPCIPKPTQTKDER